MLQQTQAERVVPYYERFLARFPDPAALAAAPPRTVLAAWSGLGYNRRALALQAAARAVVAGGWPADLRALPGVGPYTAAAVAAFAWDAPLAAVDANVRRVIERWDGRRRPPRALAARAAALLPSGRPADWNQAMMELGATVCTARAPRCAGCPVAPWCASAGAVAAPAPARRGSRPRFEDTDRWARGRVVAALLAGDAAAAARPGAPRPCAVRPRPRRADRARRRRRARAALSRGAQAARRRAASTAARTPAGVWPQPLERAAHGPAGVPQHAEQDVLGADPAIAERKRLAQRQLERLLGLGREGQPPAAAPGQRTGAERASTRRRTSSRSMPIAASAAASRPSPARRARRAARRGRARARPARPPPCRGRGQREQQVLGADRLRAQLAGLLVRQHDHLAGLLREALEHQPRRPRIRREPCFLCTACLLTPSTSAICCQLQPRSRALRTCRASSDSSSRRSEATAASPTAGSRLAVASASSVASVIVASTYIDDVILSTEVDAYAATVVTPATAPPELAALEERARVVAHLGRIHALLFWDQNTMMPPGGAVGRADHSATLETVTHERLTDPEIGRLLDVLEPWAAGEDPDADAVRLVAVMRRDFEKAVRVPTSLAAEMSRADSLGDAAWQEARAHADFSRFRDALARHLELRARYVACFPGRRAPLRRGARRLRARDDDGAGPPAAGRARRRPRAARRGRDGAGGGRPPARRVVRGRGPAAGRDGAARGRRLRCRPLAPGRLAAPVRAGDRRRRRPRDHALRHPQLRRGLLRRAARVRPRPLRGEHPRPPEAQPARPARCRSACTSPRAGSGRTSSAAGARSAPGPTAGWRATLPATVAGTTPDELFRALNRVEPSLIRVASDETTYNLHIVLRFELEVALIEGALAVDDLPHAWNEGMHRLLGLDVPDDGHGVLQDVHWGAGLIGYFPTYSLGNLMAAQLWDGLSAELPDIGERLERGEFALLREWLHDRVHVHGRKFTPPELLQRATGQELAVTPFLDYLSAKLRDAGVLPAAAA